LTKSDIKGLYSNLCDENYLHEGYYELLEKAHNKGYAIVWLTMRSLPLYKFSKNYISKYTRLQGPLLT
jgi:phosphatidate phosphatase PAH1